MTLKQTIRTKKRRKKQLKLKHQSVRRQIQTKLTWMMTKTMTQNRGMHPTNCGRKHSQVNQAMALKSQAMASQKTSKRSYQLHSSKLGSRKRYPVSQCRQQLRTKRCASWLSISVFLVEVSCSYVIFNHTIYRNYLPTLQMIQANVSVFNMIRSGWPLPELFTRSSSLASARHQFHPTLAKTITIP